jgi:hypothetical protein
LIFFDLGKYFVYTGDVIPVQHRECGRIIHVAVDEIGLAEGEDVARPHLQLIGRVFHVHDHSGGGATGIQQPGVVSALGVGFPVFQILLIGKW